MSTRIYVLASVTALVSFSMVVVYGGASCGGTAPTSVLLDGGGGNKDGSPDGTGGGAVDGGQEIDAADAAAPPPSESPIWEPFQMLLDCPVERMGNPAMVRAFGWKPCDEGVADCEQMVYEPWFSADPNAFGIDFYLYSIDLHSNSSGVFPVIATVSAEWSIALVLREDGSVLDGYRVPALDGTCVLPGGSVWGSRFGIVMRHNIAEFNHRRGGILHSLDSSGPPSVFEATSAAAGCGPATMPMGESRWLWNCSCKYVSMANSGPLDMQVLASCVDPLLHVSYIPVSTGPTFLYAETRTPDGMSLESRIVTSDGIGPPQPYLVPTDGSFYDDPAFAHSHIAWFRGIGWQNPGTYDKVEIWASAYSPNPAELAPYKVADFGWKDAPIYNRTAGYGRLAALSAAGAPAYGQAEIWDLAAKTMKTVTLPGQRRINGFIGMTPTHLWLGGMPTIVSGPIDLLYRFRVGP